MTVTVTKPVEGENRSALVAEHLVRLSVFFTVQPLPDDAWEFTVKGEAERFLDAAIKEAS